MLKNNLIGKTFGYLRVIDSAGSDKWGHALWVCECKCGKQIVKSGDNLKRGLVTSCGCRRVEVTIERLTTHGMHGTPLYNVWCGMRQRCMNPNDKEYHRYGGRGISVCEEWNDFENFHRWAIDNGYDPILSIDRVDNDDGYYPENCRWADVHTQRNNTSQNRYISSHGERHTIADWARMFNMNYGVLYRRIARGDMRDFEEYFEGRQSNNDK